MGGVYVAVLTSDGPPQSHELVNSSPFLTPLTSDLQPLPHHFKSHCAAAPDVWIQINICACAQKPAHTLMRAFTLTRIYTSITSLSA